MRSEPEDVTSPNIFPWLAIHEQPSCAMQVLFCVETYGVPLHGEGICYEFKGMLFIGDIAKFLTSLKPTFSLFSRFHYYAFGNYRKILGTISKQYNNINSKQISMQLHRFL